MSTGILYQNTRGVLLRLIENLAAAQGAPADGDAATVLKTRPTSTTFFNLAELGPDWVWPEDSTLRIYETAGSGTITLAYARLWLYDAVAKKAFPAGVGLDADKGKLNNGAAFGETGTDQLRHSEPFVYPGHCDGIQVELGTFGGTNPTFNVDWFIPPARR